MREEGRDERGEKRKGIGYAVVLEILFPQVLFTNVCSLNPCCLVQKTGNVPNSPMVVTMRGL